MSTPDELLLAVPQLMGFAPEDSVVVVVLVDARVEVCLRFDLSSLDHPLDVAAELAKVLPRYERRQVVIAGYGERDRVDEAMATLSMLVAGDTLIDCMGTDGVCWWTASGTGGHVPPRLPAEGVDAVSHLVLPTRERLQQGVAGPSAESLDAVWALVERAEDRLWGWEAGRRISHAGGLVDAFLTGHGCDLDDHLCDDCAVQLSVLAVDVDVRDAIWWTITPRNAAAHQELWQRVLQVTPDDLAPDPLCLCATASWIQGNGALMGICLERSMLLDPEHSLTVLLGQIHAARLPPTAWHELLALPAPLPASSTEPQ